MPKRVVGIVANHGEHGEELVVPVRRGRLPRNRFSRGDHGDGLQGPMAKTAPQAERSCVKEHTAPQQRGGGSGERARQTEPDGRVSGMLKAGVVRGLWEGRPSWSAMPTARRMFLP